MSGGKGYFRDFSHFWPSSGASHGLKSEDGGFPKSGMTHPVSCKPQRGLEGLGRVRKGVFSNFYAICGSFQRFPGLSDE